MHIEALELTNFWKAGYLETSLGHTFLIHPLINQSLEVGDLALQTSLLMPYFVLNQSITCINFKKRLLPMITMYLAL